jgi:Mor family transcriptional regulator
LLGEFVECISRELVSIAAIEPSRADKIAVAVVEKVAQDFGGAYFYLPRNVESERSVRDDSIYRRFLAGEAADDLAAELKLSVVRVYQIVARCKKEDAHAAQVESQVREQLDSRRRKQAAKQAEKDANQRAQEKKKAAAPTTHGRYAATAL